MKIVSSDEMAGAPRTLGKAWLYLKRAISLRCPTCGDKPLFQSWSNVRSLQDWFTPLDGCPVCGYAFEREPGYFLLAIWGVNYGLVAFSGMLLYLLLRSATDLSPDLLLWICLLPAPAVSLLLARHAKAFFLAMDHFCDPHVRPKRKIKKAE